MLIHSVTDLFERPHYVNKFKTLTEGIISPSESEHFLDRVQNLSTLTGEQLLELSVQVDAMDLECKDRDTGDLLMLFC